MEHLSLDAEPTEALELITFMVAGQEFALDICDIIEIRGWTPATPIAQAPAHVKGVISLRGVVMPVIDFCVRLGGSPIDPSERNVIIVTQVAAGQVGFLVEAVCDTLMVERSQIQPAGSASAGEAPRFVQGFLPLADRMVTLLKLRDVMDVAPVKQLLAA